MTGNSNLAHTLGLAGDDDRRRFRRFHIKLPVRELTPEHHVTYATSVSAGGLFCPDATPRPEGSRALLEIDLLGKSGPVVVVGRAVRLGSGAGFGVGWQFDAPQPLLDELLERAGQADG